MKRWLSLNSLTGTYVSCFEPLGSEDWGLLYSDIASPILGKRQIGFLFDPIFRQPNKYLKQRWPTRHCDNLQLDGAITIGSLVGEDIELVGSKVGLPSIRRNGVIFINAFAERDSVRYHESGTPGVLKGLTWKSWASSPDFPGTPGRFVYACYFSQRGDTNLAYYYATLLFVCPTGASEIITWLLGGKPSFGEAEVEANRSVDSFPVDDYVYDGLVPPTYSAGVEISHGDPDLALSVFNSLDAATFNKNLRADFDMNLFRRAVDRYRPKRVSFFETAIGLAELPATVKGIVSTMYNLANKPMPQTLVLKSLIGLYLCYCYAIRPMPDDAKIMASWLKTLTNYHRFDGASIQTQAVYSSDGWMGTQRAEIALHPIITDVPPDINETLDSIESNDHVLGVGDSFRLVPRAGHADLDLLNIMDCFPVTPGDITADVWNTIGYSFVCDWGLDLDGRLRAVGTDTYLSMLPVRFSCQSVKAEKNISDQVSDLFSVALGSTVTASVTALKYERAYADNVPPLPDYEYQPTSISSVWMQGLALLLQRSL